MKLMFLSDRMKDIAWGPTTMNMLQRVAEFKGKQALYFQQSLEILTAMKNVALIQSTESSNRIEKIVVTNKRLTEIVNERVDPVDRSESEIAGYRDVLKVIHESYEHMPVTSNVILQLHRNLLQYATGSGGSYKMSDNDITEELPSGETIIRFKPVSAFETKQAMQDLVNGFRKRKEEALYPELLLIAIFILDFLSIHPFPDGNGRMARLLTLLLLYQAGYEVGRYISLEKCIEDTKDQYYATLQKSSQGWHEGTNDVRPWVEYFLTMLIEGHQRFEQRMGDLDRGRGWKSRQVEGVIQHLMGDFSVADLLERCPGITGPTIRQVLARMSKKGHIVAITKGRNARWRKIFGDED
ncbi:Fic family protein [Paenibacillus sp. F411]|uniref:Fic family protein n=1 Tax=Paenibacillus sp. F411 TaxID=2820239 RepID=UPI001AAF842A|nr:Fic family protein [Paenibacillus sp. F411]MBO2943332.1 Fic family protein [Paenibacillus sp. F411]